MLIKLSFSVIVTCLVLQTVSATEDVLIQILSKRFINQISDKYISFSIDPMDLLNALNSSTTGQLLREIKRLGPSHLRIAGASTNKLTLTQNAGSSISNSQMQISLNDWKRLYKMIRLMDLKPIIALPYDPQNWNTRQAIQILGASNKLGFEECIWQLGSDFNTTDAINYVDDLSTLRTIVDAFMTQNPENQWSVVGNDLSEASSEDEARLYSELSEHIVDAVGWVQSYDYSPADSMEDIFIGKDRALRTLLNGKLPVWFTLTQTTPFFVTEKRCSPQCQQNGLSWAKTLGDASRNGFKVVFSPIDMANVATPSLSYYITFLHKKLIGDEVFDTRMLAGSRLSSHFYSYCTRNISGAFTVVGINADDTRLKVFAKMPNTFTGSEVHQYVLAVDAQSGSIQLNGEDIAGNSALEPIVKAKRPMKAITFSLPALSIGFWVFPHANLHECIKMGKDAQSSDRSSEYVRGTAKTSKELLLQQLIIETINKETVEEDSSNNAPIKKDATLVKRKRRDLTNSIPIDDTLNQAAANKKTDELNVENADSSIYKRNRRFITDANRPRRNLVDIIYKEVDDVKRKRIFAPYNSRNTAIFGKHARSKRQLSPGFAKLFQKFEMMKPKKFGLKPVPAKNNRNAAAIPPIATVHDIYSPQSAELKIFRSSENRDLPHGDVYLELANNQQSPDYVAYEDGLMTGQQQRQQHGNPAHDELEQAAVPNMPNEFFEHMTGEFVHSKPVSRPNSQYSTANSGRSELMEADVYQQPNPSQPTHHDQPTAPHREMEFVVQELQPTWQKNRQNLMETRSNLREIYVGNQGQPIVVDTHAPTVDYEEDYDANDGFFRSNRRRRSVDPAMNDQIEEKLKTIEQEHEGINDAAETNQDHDDIREYITHSVDKINLLDKMLQIVDQIDQTEGNNSDENYNKLSAEIKELESFIYRKIPQIGKKIHTRKNRLSPADIRRKCKVMASTLEQKCMRDEEQFEKNLFKREVKITNEDKTVKRKPLQKIVKKLFPKTSAAIAEKKKLREKRNAIFRTTPTDENDFISNHIPKESGEDIPVLKTVYSRHGNDLKAADWSDSSLENTETKASQAHRQEQTNEQSAGESTSKSKITISNIKNEHIPKIMRTVTGVADRVIDAVHRHVSGWWKMLS